jgi:peptidoglycan/LPS O-acetylase OafA/YrhL
MATPARQTLPALTSLRFFAAAMIVLFHCENTFGFQPGYYYPFHLPQAVSLFFVLSGFILTLAYPTLEGWGERGRFLLARFSRVWPAHVVGLLLAVRLLGWQSYGIFSNLGLFGLNLSLLHSWFPIPALNFSYNRVSWSISTEFAFYLFFLILIPNWRRTWYVKLALAFGAVLGMGWLCFRLHVPAYDSTGQQMDVHAMMYLNPVTRVFEFVLGMSCCLAWQGLQPRLKLGRFSGTLLELAALGLAGTAMYFTPTLAEAAVKVEWLGHPARNWLFHAGAAPAFAVLILVLALGRGWISRSLEFRPLVLLGEISYSMYLLHDLVLRWYTTSSNAFEDLPARGMFLGLWVLILLASHLTWAMIERPTRAFLVGLWPRSGRSVRAEAPAAPRSVWHWLFNPGPRLLTVEAALLALFIAGLYTQSKARQYRFLVAGEARMLAERGEAEARDTCFGDRLILRGAEVSKTPSREMKVSLIWESQKDSPLDLVVGVEVLDYQGKGLFSVYAPSEAHPSALKAGKLWQEKVLLPNWMSISTDRLALFVLKDGQRLPVDRGPRSPAHNNLHLPMPGRQLPPSATAQASR